MPNFLLTLSSCFLPTHAAEEKCNVLSSQMGISQHPCFSFKYNVIWNLWEEFVVIFSKGGDWIHPRSCAWTKWYADTWYNSSFQHMLHPYVVFRKESKELETRSTYWEMGLKIKVVRIMKSFLPFMNFTKNICCC
jgi:hypothetical protein